MCPIFHRYLKLIWWKRIRIIVILKKKIICEVVGTWNFLPFHILLLFSIDNKILKIFRLILILFLFISQTHLHHPYYGTVILTFNLITVIYDIALKADTLSPLRIVVRTQWFIIEFKFNTSIIVIYSMTRYTRNLLIIMYHSDFPSFIFVILTLLDKEYLCIYYV